MEYRRGLQAYAWALAFVGAIAVAYPFADWILTNLPTDFGRVEWRYQLTGRLSQMIITPIIGMVMILGAALLRRSSRMARGVGVVAYLMAAALLGATALFAVDTPEARSLVPETARGTFTLGGIRAIAKNVISVAGLALIGWAAFRSSTMHDPWASSKDDPSGDGLFGT